MKTEKEFLPSTKSEKIFRIINICLTVAIMLTGVALAIYYKVEGDPNNRFVPSLGLLLYGFIPLAYELIARSKLPNSVFLIFNIYLGIAGLWGSALSGYINVSWLDMAVHFVMGYLIAALGLFFLCRTGENKKMKIATVAMFCLFMSLFVEAGWELCERCIDLIFNLDVQGAVVEGTNAPLLTDTIQDIACNMGGALLFTIHFLIAKLTRKDLGIASMEKEFEIRHRLFEKKDKKSEKNIENIEKNN